MHAHVAQRRGTTLGPIDSGGTKWPSMTSTWITCAPAATHLLDLLAQAPEVGGEDRRGDLDRHRGHTSTQHRLPPQHRLQCDRVVGARHPHDRRVLAAARADRAQLEAVQAVARSGSGPGRFGRPQPRLAARRARQPEARASAIGGNIEAVGAVLGRRSVRQKSSRLQALLAAARACRRSRRAARRAAAARRARREHRVLLGAPARSTSSGVHAPAQVGVRAAACRGPLHGGSSSTRSNAVGVVGASRVGDDARARSTARIRAQVRSQRRGAPRVALDGDDLALAAHQRREVRRLAARRGAEVEHALAGLRVDEPRDALRRARLRHERAGARSRVRERVERAVDDDRVAVAAAGDVARAATSPSTSVLTRSASSAGSLSAASSARVRSRPSQSHHSSTIHSGCAWRIAAPAGVSSPGSSTPSRWTRRSTALTSRWPGARLGELDRLGDRGVVGDAVEEQQLVEAEVQRRAHAAGRASPVRAARRRSSRACRARCTAPKASRLASARSRGVEAARPRRAARGRRRRRLEASPHDRVARHGAPGSRSRGAPGSAAVDGARARARSPRRPSAGRRAAGPRAARAARPRPTRAAPDAEEASRRRAASRAPMCGVQRAHDALVLDRAGARGSSVRSGGPIFSA